MSATDPPRPGVLPRQEIEAAIANGAVAAEIPIEAGQIQPASLDLRLGPRAYRVMASFLPGRRATVAEKLAQYAMHEVDLSAGAVLERGCVYVAPLLERLALPRRLSGLANPKSSTGRLDIFARVITDCGTEFDRIPEAYRGPLYAEISPRTFSVRVAAGARLAQLRVRRGAPVSSESEMRKLQEEVGLVRAQGAGDAPEIVRRGVTFSADLSGAGEGAVIGYRARRHAPLIDLDRIAWYDPADFWEPITARPGRGLILNPDDFYILASREHVAVPPDYAAEMRAYDTLVGEFRVHYAGFFDPGFGWDEAGGAGARAVLEVRSHDVPFMIEDGQIVGRLAYERLAQRPDQLYGREVKSNYQAQGLKLAKQFKSFT